MESEIWNQFLSARKAGTTPLLPDYSYAGYGLGEDSIPSAEGKIFLVTDYGAVPDDDGNDREAIEAAIEAAEAYGGGVVAFPPGVFHVNDQPGMSRSITINTDKIILRGAGSGPGGTVLFMKEHMLPVDPEKKWTTPHLFEFVLTADRNQRPVLTRITGSSLRESFAITVEDSEPLEVGMYVTLEMRNPEANSEFLDGLEPWPVWTSTIEQGVNVRGETHRIVAIEGEKVMFAEPIHCSINPDYGWNVRLAPMGIGWGVEDIHFQGNFHDEFVHHLDARHDSGWSILSFARGRFPYVRRCRFSDVSAAVSMSACYAGTIINCSIEGNQGHSSFAGNYFSYGTLIAFCHDVVPEGAFHGFGANAGAVGTVITRSKNSNRGFDWHGSYPYATLIDACRGGLIGNGGNFKVLPNHMRHLTFWNFEQSAGEVFVEYDWWPPRRGDEIYSGAKVVRPIIVGFHGLPTTFKADHCEIIESYGAPVIPESLFEAQLKARFGSLPDWISIAGQQSEFFETNGYFKISTMTDQRPNILFIWTDQQAPGAMSCAGNPHLNTPAMDSLARAGVRFEQAYCTDPICVPSRTSWLTGSMPHQTGVTFNIDDQGINRPPLAPLLREAGYDTGYVGKWHIPRSAEDTEWHGFDYVRHARANKLDPDVPAAAIEFLKKERDAPFFLVASFVNPHDICEWARLTAGMGGSLPNGSIPPAPPAEDCPPLPANFEIPRPEPDVIRDLQPLAPGTYPTVDWDEGLWRQYLWAYYRLIEKVDAQIGLVLEALKESGQDENTLIVFSTDHGDGSTSHRWNQKTVFYEEVAGVPFIIRPPGRPISGRTDTDNLVSMNLDFFPTAFDYAGIEKPVGLEGRSLRPLMEGRSGATGHEFVISQNDLAPVYGVTGGVYGRMIRTERFKYIRYSKGGHREQLFDLESDPGETQNLAYLPAFAAEKQRCRDLLDTWMEGIGDPFPTLEEDGS